MPISGITKEEEKIIQAILLPFMGKYEFFYYGSRVKGNFRNLSDLDILLKSNHIIDIDDIENIKKQFDESDLSYIVNITDYNNLTPDFYELIKKDLVKIDQ